jgi:hypothetical protein
MLIAQGVDFIAPCCHTTFINTKQMDFDTSIWDEIQDMPGEIFDMEDFNEMKQELFGLIDSCIQLESN